MDAKKELKKIGCIRSGHFIGVSTKHLAGYVNYDVLLPHVELVSKLIEQLVDSFKDDAIETVVTPAVSAIPFSHWGAHYLSKNSKKEIFGVWADKVVGAPTREFIFERESFVEKVKGKRVIILDDIINQMASAKAMIKTVTNAGGIIVGFGCISANKGVSAEALGVPKLSMLTTTEYNTWAPEECAKTGLCSKNVPIVEDIGHGDDFKKSHPNYAGGYVRLIS
ncbi:hypothetical protein KBC85_02235 [Candidatus Saccharibacteria bacterium]|nr:hypothetical protein [Candidatus Saccharibacteria bacterium]MDQ5885475.1 orotate phosphoribosyltransferase [Patescibacteria group bacterium]MDQ5953927.1 orotate phosphoribosyltransferase [Patescibacteria group bacterium]MDQ5958486.1 orotate phosphoribosyltransferase [Patescibacteria group bacterium]